jgi:hypothetical protein
MWRHMHIDAADAAYGALGKIFWGTLLCILDLSVSTESNGFGFKFDFLNDAIGAGLIAWGISDLRPVLNDPDYSAIIGFCYPPALLAIASAILEHFIVPWPAPMKLLAVGFSFWCSIAIFRFCFAMQLLCEAASLPEAAASWRFSRGFFLYLGLIPKALFECWNSLAIVTGQSWSIDIGPLAFALVILFLPIIHILVSIARTRTGLTSNAQVGRFA